MTAEEAQEIQRDKLAQLNAIYAFCEIGHKDTKPAIIEFDSMGRIAKRRPLAGFKTYFDIVDQSQVPTRKPGTDPPEWKYVSAASWWLSHPEVRCHPQVVLAPPGSAVILSARDHNLWRGYAVAPADGDWSLNYTFLTETICDGDMDLANWLINWLAALMQRPGQRGHVAPLLVGGQGIGKGHFSQEIVGRMFDKSEYIHLSSGKELTGEFSDHLSGKIVVFLDEAFMSDRDAINQTKRLITEDSIIVHPKYLPRYEEPSCLHLILASNADLPLFIERDDRRFAVFQVSEQHKQDDGYFGRLRAELNSGGRAALLRELLDYEVDWPLSRSAPQSRAKVGMKAKSQEPIIQFWRSYLSEEFAEEAVNCETLHQRCLDWHIQHGYRGPFPSTQVLSSVLAKLFAKGGYPSWPRRRRASTGKRPWQWVFPPRDACFAVFEQMTGVPVDDLQEDPPA